MTGHPSWERNSLREWRRQAPCRRHAADHRFAADRAAEQRSHVVHSLAAQQLSGAGRTEVRHWIELIDKALIRASGDGPRATSGPKPEARGTRPNNHFSPRAQSPKPKARSPKPEARSPKPGDPLL